MGKAFTLDTANEGELVAYGRDELGLKLTRTMKRETMVQKCRDALVDLNIPEPAAAEELSEDAPPGANYVTIRIEKEKGKGGDAPVFVGLNGKGYTIPRGRPIKVPAPLCEVLDHALQTLYEYDDDTGEMIGTEVLSYPYQVLSR